MKARLLALLFTLLIAPMMLSNVGQSHVSTPLENAAVYEPTVVPREVTVYITRTGERYHRGSCRYLRQSKIAIKKKDAIAQGYTACKVCRP